MPEGGKIGFYIFTQDRQCEFYSDSADDRKTWIDMYECVSILCFFFLVVVIWGFPSLKCRKR
jgi:hypothetical protein